jgi:tRNA dimethylallyltransferase
MLKLPKLIVILGPTASGKSDLAIAIAKEIHGEIIATDSRTVYREMNIGTAKPKGAAVSTISLRPKIGELFSERPYIVEGIEHWGIDLVNPDEHFSVMDFKKYAEEKIREITKRGRVPMMVGGTGLYIEAVVQNYLFEKGKGESKYDALQIGITRDREELYRRIEERVDKMIALGLVDEVRALQAKYGCETKAMTGIGYRQICQFLRGEMSLKEAVEKLKRDTRHYAKRQMTWFRRDDSIEWMSNGQEILERVQDFLLIQGDA